MRRAATIVDAACLRVRTFRCRLTSLIVASLLLASEASAQLPILPPGNPLIGKRVRITRQSLPHDRLVGRLLAMTPDSVAIAVAPTDEARFLALDAETRLETWGRGSGAEIMGTVLGTAGALGGATYYVHWCRNNPDACAEDLSYKHDDDDCDDDDTCDNANMTFLSFTVLGGMLAGAALGYALIPPRWQPVDQPFRVSVVPAGGGRVFIGASYAFFARPLR
jgi:hypothetical protein